MSKLLRAVGKGGVEIFSGDDYTEDQVKMMYSDEHGYEVEYIDTFTFDACTANELMEFARSGGRDQQ